MVKRRRKAKSKKFPNRSKLAIILIVLVVAAILVVSRDYIISSIHTVPPKCGTILYGTDASLTHSQYPGLSIDCFLDAYNSNQTASLNLLFGGVDTISAYNLTIIPSGQKYIRVFYLFYMAPGAHTFNITYNCTGLAQEFNASYNSSGLMMSGCSGGFSGSFIPEKTK